MAQAPPVVRVIAQSLSTPPQPPSRQVPRSSTVIGGLCVNIWRRSVFVTHDTHTLKFKCKKSVTRADGKFC